MKNYSVGKSLNINNSAAVEAVAAAAVVVATSKGDSYPKKYRTGSTHWPQRILLKLMKPILDNFNVGAAQVN